MSISHRHFDRLVPKQLLHLGQCRTGLYQLAGERVTQIVKVKIGNLCPLQRGHPSMLKVVPELPGLGGREYQLCPNTPRRLLAGDILTGINSRASRNH